MHSWPHLFLQLDCFCTGYYIAISKYELSMYTRRPAYTFLIARTNPPVTYSYSQVLNKFIRQPSVAIEWLCGSCHCCSFSWTDFIESALIFEAFSIVSTIYTHERSLSGILYSQVYSVATAGSMFQLKILNIKYSC